jgi:hypothetical protein
MALVSGPAQAFLLGCSHFSHRLGHASCPVHAAFALCHALTTRSAGGCSQLDDFQNELKAQTERVIRAASPEPPFDSRRGMLLSPASTCTGPCRGARPCASEKYHHGRTIAGTRTQVSSSCCAGAQPEASAAAAYAAPTGHSAAGMAYAAQQAQHQEPHHSSAGAYSAPAGSGFGGMPTGGGMFAGGMDAGGDAGDMGMDDMFR